jgi:hypothetical protein
MDYRTKTSYGVENALRYFEYDFSELEDLFYHSHNYQINLNFPYLIKHFNKLEFPKYKYRNKEKVEE